MKKKVTTRVRRTQCDYGLAFKLQVVSQIEKGELTPSQAKKKYGVQGKSTVLKWLRKLGTLNWTTKDLQALNKKELTPEQRIKELETQLQEEKDRNLVYKTMVEIFEKEYGASAPKKSSPKPSKGSGKQKR